MQTYQFADGHQALLNSIPTPLFEPDFGMAFEIVLPVSEEDFESVRGETVWACGDQFTQAARRNNMTGSICFVRVLNDSFHYSKLRYGKIIPIILRGQQQPIALVGEIRRFI